MATIYKITNKINKKCYIGKTIRPVQIRWSEHIQESKKNNNIPLYNAFNKYGIENFLFEIIETNIPNEQIDIKEKYYINFYSSKVNQNGYNVADGGNGGKTCSKLSQQDVKNIIIELQDDNNLKHFSQLAQQYNVSLRTIIAINNGETWYNHLYSYPLRKYNTTGLTISKLQYKNIIKDIQQTKLSFKDIQKKYSLSEIQMSNINNGYYCYNGQHPYYKNIYNGPFPIRNTNLKIQIQNIFPNILYDILFTSLSITKISEKYHINNSTLQYIVNGKRRKELTQKYYAPLRRNIEYNKKIFLQLYPQFKGDDAKCVSLD